MSDQPYLSVIIPFYKQEKTVRKNIEHIISVLETTPYTFEIIPVVDGTQLDATLQEAKRVRDTRVLPTGYEENRGKGFAVRYGMKQATGQIVTFLDGGMDIDPQGIVMLLEHMKWYEADIIIGSKLHAASLVQYPWQRRVLTYGYYMLVKLLFGLRVRDTQTGLKAFKRSVLEKVLPRLLVKQFAFDIEILAVANRLGFKKIYDAPVRVDLDFKDSSIEIFGKNGVFPMLLDTMAIWYRLNVLRYYEGRYQKSRVYDKVLGMFVNH